MGAGAVTDLELLPSMFVPFLLVDASQAVSAPSPYLTVMDEERGG